MRHIEDRAYENIQVWLLLHSCKIIVKILIYKKRIAGFTDVLLNTATLLQSLTWQFYALTPVTTNILQCIQKMRWFPVHNALVATMLSCCCCHVVLQTGLRCCKKGSCNCLLLIISAGCRLLLLVTTVDTYFYYLQVRVAGVPNADWSVLVHLAVLAKRGGCSSCWAQTGRQQLQQLIHQNAIFSLCFPPLL